MGQVTRALGSPSVNDRVRVPKTADVVAQAIRSRIISGEIDEGEPLPSEAELMLQFGVSRPSLREAFRILESEKLIVVRRGSRGGARAMRPDLTVAARYMGLLMQFEKVLLRDVFEARALIEPLALRLLAQRPDRKAAAKTLLAIIEPITPDDDVRERAETWLEFFTTLFHLAGNRTLEILYGTLTDVIRQELLDSVVGSDETGASLRAVKRAMDLVAAGDADEASNFWLDQMLAIQSSVASQHLSKTVADITIHTW